MPPAVGIAGAFLGTTIIGSVTVGGLLATVAVSGASYLLNQPKKSGLNTGIDEGLKFITREPVPIQRMIFGKAFVGGPLFFSEVKPPYLYYGIVLASHKIDGIDKMMIGDIECPVDVDGNATSTPYRDGSEVYVQLSIRNGDDDQPIDPILAADFPELDASTFRQRGHATAVVKMHYGDSVDHHEKLWGNAEPAVRFVVRGMPVFDPRDVSQVSTDASTWKWSDNPTLCTASWLTHRNGGAISYNKIGLERLKASADDDDQIVTLSDGSTQKKYTCNGVVSLRTKPITILQNLLTSNLGRIIWSNGKYYLSSGVYKPPSWTLTDDSARGAMSVRYGKPRQDLLNTVRTRFTAPEREYEIVDGPVFNNTSYVADDGRIHETTIELPFTSTHTAAQRIAKATMERSRLGKQVIRRESFDALRLSATDIVNLDSQVFEQAQGQYELNRLSLTDNMEFEVELDETSPEIYDFDPSEYKTFESAPAELEGVN